MVNIGARKNSRVGDNLKWLSIGEEHDTACNRPAISKAPCLLQINQGYQYPVCSSLSALMSC